MLCYDVSQQVQVCSHCKTMCVLVILTDNRYTALHLITVQHREDKMIKWTATYVSLTDLENELQIVSLQTKSRISKCQLPVFYNLS